MIDGKPALCGWLTKIFGLMSVSSIRGVLSIEPQSQCGLSSRRRSEGGGKGKEESEQAAVMSLAALPEVPTTPALPDLSDVEDHNSPDLTPVATEAELAACDVLRGPASLH